MRHTLIVLVLLLQLRLADALLFVQRNERRAWTDLSGLWWFVREPTNGPGYGLANQWYLEDISKFENATVMPVPSAYNDIGVEASLRDHIGWVWYQVDITPQPPSFTTRHRLRFGSVNYAAYVYLNGEEIGRHIGGHLPFELDVSDKIKLGDRNRITVAVNNTLSWQTIPMGAFNYKSDIRNGSQRYEPGFFINEGYMDFFNYAGILRPVYLLHLPSVTIDNILVQADNEGTFSYQIWYGGAGSEGGKLEVAVLDSDQRVLFTSSSPKAQGQLENASLWWPRGMGAPTLYSLQVKILDSRSNSLIDVYRQNFGFRTVRWDADKIYINDKPFYCLGFGMHEDADIRGRGFDPVTMTKDLNLLEWMGANCYRTSHYPYAEERQHECDRRGIAVIVETPAVALVGFSNVNRALHSQMIVDMIERDRNHPSVIAWSLANEPKSERKEARPYFQHLVALSHKLDATRPITAVYGPTNSDTDQTADLFDVICVNRYYGWYIDMGKIGQVSRSVTWDVKAWKNKFGKPILITEYGAEALPGLSMEPSVDFSENYQIEVLRKTHDAFDELREEGILAGEMIWNFADFMTGMSVSRAVGNHKGVFTRQRQPKMSAYLLRDRYRSLLSQTSSIFGPATTASPATTTSLQPLLLRMLDVVPLRPARPVVVAALQMETGSGQDPAG